MKKREYLKSHGFAVFEHNVAAATNNNMKMQSEI